MLLFYINSILMFYPKICFRKQEDINVICATMSLYKEVHELNRKEIKNYFEIFVECDTKELIRRNQKGLYSQAVKGERNDVVGVNLPYDKPQNCELVIDNSKKIDLNIKAKEILNLIGEI